MVKSGRNSLTTGVVLSLAYILGLLSTVVPWGGIVVLGLGGVVALLSQQRGNSILPHFLRSKFSRKTWIIAGVVGLLASLYFQLRVPYPGVHDISQLVSAAHAIAQRETVTVSGRVSDMPRLTRSGKSQLWLEVYRVDGASQAQQTKIAPEQVRGKVYVTLPLLQATGIHTGQAIAITGSLYLPKPATNPGGFDFQKYLAQEGCFAALRGRAVEILDAGNQWGWWVVQQRIVRSQIDRLGSPEGQLISSMVLGSRVVDLPYDIKDQFTKIGLSHALAASGFQVTLILGVVLALLKRFSERVQAGVGFAALLSFLALAGPQPAVLRAIIMGAGALIGLVMQRRVKPLGALLLSATLLLLANPIWIWSLSFQLSFLATLGLLVTVPALTKRLDWLPTIIAPLIAVPIAAYIWTLPLQLYAFGVVSPYSILVNIIVTPLISIISIGGIISGLFALVAPIAGSMSAWLLHYPTYALLAIVEFFCQLPGNAIAVGTIPALTTLVLYALICLPWLRPQQQRQLWIIGLAAISLVFLPAWQARASLLQVTVLATSREPVLVIQDHGRVTLVNSGDKSTVGLTILPFLQKEGINTIDWAVSTTSTQESIASWLTLLERMPIRSFYQMADAKAEAQLINRVETRKGRYSPLTIGQTLKMGSTSVHLLSTDPSIVQFQIDKQNWLWLKDSPKKQQNEVLSALAAKRHQVLWWSGRSLKTELIEQLKPQVAIAYSNKIDSDTLKQLQKQQTQIYWTAKDGAIRWTPNKKFEKTVEAREEAPT